MKSIKFSSKAQRFAFICALFASKHAGMYSPGKHDVKDEFSRLTVTHDDAAHSPEVDEIESGTPEVVSALFDREPAGGEELLNGAERARAKKDLEKYRISLLCAASVENMATS